jgi:hypothetical protein
VARGAADLSDTKRSREYKIPLVPGRFETRKDGAEEFLEAVQAIAEDLGATFEVKTKEKKRTVVFLDTDPNSFRPEGFVLRVRSEKEDDGPEVESKVTLKFRSDNLALAQVADVRCHADDPDPKLEDDISPSGTRFSHSVSFETEGTEPFTFETVRDAKSVFPALARLADADDRLHVVRGMEVDERVMKKSEMVFEGFEEIEAVCTFWFNASRDVENDTTPVIAEFSFGYETGGVDDIEELNKLSDELFGRVQAELADWVRADGTTKTKFVYTGR